MGRTLCDRYRVDSVIGTGGMGAVCLAYDGKLDRRVAVKVMTAVCPEPGELERMRQRFYREARAAARLRHPNVVTVHDFGTDPDLEIDFLVMELLEGEDLLAHMRRAAGPLPPREVLEILREAAMGLAAGHRVHLIHRDVKPGNVFLVAEPGGWEVKLLDFGIAQVGAADGDTPTRLTVAVSPHTPRYASPEQLRGDPRLTPASDVYSLALTGLEMLGGAYPAGVNTDPHDREAARTIKRVVDTHPGVSLRLAAVLRHALRLDPAARFPDAGALLDALAECDTVVPVSAPTPAPLRRPAPAAPDQTLYAPVHDEPDGTLYAPVHGEPDGTMLAPPLDGGPPPVPSPAAPAREPPSGAAPAWWRPPPALWLSLLALFLLVLLGFYVSERRSPDADTNPPVVETGSPREAGGVALAREEARRVARLGARDGESLVLVVLASFDGGDLAEARAMRDRLRARGVDAGLANSRVYPELLDGYVVVVAGPYDGEQALEQLEELRARVAPDAFLKRVTVRAP